jgi:hypothetical protein
MNKKNISSLALFASLILLVTFSIGSGSSLANTPRIHIKNGASLNWSGYAVESSLSSPSSGVVSDVKGSWVVPSVTGPSKGSYYSSAWVGIDGYSDSTVEQIGTEQDWVKGKAKYYAWFEMYPGPAYRILASVKPGDTMSAEVQYVGNNQFTLTITDTPVKGRAWRFSTTQTLASAQLQSAEWIMEAPSSSSSGAILPLADFGTVYFTNCQATLNGHTGTINDNTWQYDNMAMTTSSGTVKARPSALSSDGGSFSVTWYNS